MKKIIIANWKMQLSVMDSLKLIKNYKLLARSTSNKLRDFNVVVCPDFLSLDMAVKSFKNLNLKIGAQNCASVNCGPWTGEISPLNLKKIGITHVILGHSERRQKLQEGASLINEKIKAALDNKLIPIVCVGENLAQRKSGRVKKVLLEQLQLALYNIRLKKASDLIIAYEPIWAIGSGKIPTMSEIQEVHEFVQLQTAKLVGQSLPVIYGGSVNKSNAHNIMLNKNVAGLLVGGFSLQASSFFGLIKK